MNSPHYLLRPGVHFLNHGSYGACPTRVLERFHAWHREMEAQPVEFLNRRFRGLMHEARTHLGAYLHADPARLVFVPNATHALNIAAASIPLGAGDVVLTTSHEYGATDRMWEKICAARGACYQRVDIPLPAPDAEAIAARLLEQLTPTVKVLFLSHLTSPTAMRLPVEQVVPAARTAGVITMIDGAHAPGQIPLDLEALGADLYIGNCHKWLSAPKSAAFLSASARASAWVEPRIVSWGTPGQDCDTFVSEIEYQGTSDICAALSVVEAIRVQEKHDWPSVRVRCASLLLETEARVGEITGLPSIYTDPATRCPQMVSMLLPERDPMEYKTRLLEEHGMEIPVFRFGPHVMTRASAQAYNTREDYDALVRGIRSITAGP